jgi:cardiolipin synthase
MGTFFDFDLTVMTRLPSLWAALLHFALALFVSMHVVLRKRDPRSAVAWLGVIWLSPFVGAFLYYVLGINRITRKASKLRPRGGGGDVNGRGFTPHAPGHGNDGISRFADRLHKYVNQLVPRPAVDGNQVDILGGGEVAYPAMIEAINQAKTSIAMSSYIFDRGRIARDFIGALKLATARGVEVRVLVDAVGAHYTLPTVNSLFRKAGVRLRYFLPVIFPWQFGTTNLRNHRKVLIVDGWLAFTGGLNIRDRHDRRLSKIWSYVEDMHFRVAGPVVQQLQEVFVDDWNFATGERLTGKRWFPGQYPSGGPSRCRAVADGPDENFEKIKWILQGAITKATERVWIVSPYFVPDSDLLASLKIAALSGVDVRIIVPRHNNIPFVQWASLALFPGLVDVGIKVYLSKPPFDHSKLMVADRDWSFIGSSNWDARSLRLNFELNVEVYDRELNRRLADIFERKQELSKQVDRIWFAKRKLWQRLRDNSARLLSPYL